MMKIFAHTILILLLACGALAQNKRVPKFEDYRVSETFTGKPARAKIVGRDARMFRTRIRLGAEEGPNFAGHFTIVYWGCGSDCIGFAVVDAKTGKVYFPEGFGAVLRVPFQTEEKLNYRKDSSLLIISGSRLNYGASGRKVSEDAGKFYYRWTGNRLVLIRSTKLELKGELPF